MKFENASIKNLESVEEYVEKLMLSGKIFQREYVEEHIFIGLQRSGCAQLSLHSLLLLCALKRIRKYARTNA